LKEPQAVLSTLLESGVVVQGRHVLAELSGCPARLLDDAARLQQLLCDCARQGGATVVSAHFHHFSPQGVSGVVIIAESHITIHSWPEFGYAAVDVFTCGHAEVAERVMQLISTALQAAEVKQTSFERNAQGAHKI